MHAELACGVLAAVPRGNEVAGAEFDQIAALGQPLQHRFELRAVAAARSPFPHKLFESGACVRQLMNVGEQGIRTHRFAAHGGSKMWGLIKKWNLRPSGSKSPKTAIS